MRNKIIFFRYLPLTETIERDFNFFFLIRNGYTVEYWDLTGLYYPHLVGAEKYNSALPINQCFFTNFQELSSSIKENKDALFWSIMTLTPELYRLWWLLSKNKCTMTFFCQWEVPFDLNYSTNLSIIKRILLKFNSASFKQRMFASLFHLGLLKYYDCIFQAGTEGWKSIGYSSPKLLKEIPKYDLNSINYNYFLSSDRSSEDGNYILFIDQYLPFHPDNQVCKLQSVNPDKYYREINHILGLLEQKYNRKVIVAAHPKALKYKDTNYYEGREVYFGKTMNLVSKSSIVISHNSTALSYAVMYDKPIMLIDLDEIRRVNISFSDCTRNFSKYFKCALITEEWNTLDCFPKDEDLCIGNGYMDYKTKHFTSLLVKEKNEMLLKQYLMDIFSNRIV